VERRREGRNEREQVATRKRHERDETEYQKNKGKAMKREIWKGEKGGGKTNSWRQA